MCNIIEMCIKVVESGRKCGGFVKGEYQHAIDAKGRLIMPAKLREELGETFVVSKGLDGCLFVYSDSEWESLEASIKAQPTTKRRKMERFFLSSAIDCSVDAQGRILISSNLREHANLKKEVTIIGVSNRAEIWNTEAWREYNEDITLEEIEQSMEEIGF